MEDSAPPPLVAPATFRGARVPCQPAKVSWWPGRTMLAFLVVVSALRADDWAPNITTTAGWNGNTTNADRASDRIGTFHLGLELLSTRRYEAGRDDSFQLAGHLGGEWWTRFRGLGTLATGARADWRHKFGVSAVAPILVIEAYGDAIAAKESGRRGSASGVAISVRKRFDDLTRGTLAHEYSILNASHGVFDRTANETTLEVDRDLTDVSRLSFTARFRRGDVVSYASSPRPDLATLARRQVDLDTFGQTMTAYRIDATTWSARMAFLRALSLQTAWVLAYEWRQTERGPLRFTNHVTSTAWVHQF